MVSYLNMIYKAASSNKVTRLGWNEDGQFQWLGGRITKQSVFDADRVFDFYNDCKKGSVPEWRQAAHVLYRTNKKLFFLVTSSFASVLLDMMGWNSAVVSVAGRSGYGKTTALKVALSVWGNPDELIHSGSSTLTSLEESLVYMKDMPVGFDDCQSIRSGIRKYIMLAANGCSRRRAGKKNVNVTWHLIPMMTSNKTLMDLDNLKFSEQERVRLLELIITLPLPSIEANRIHSILADNYGTAGVFFARYVMYHKEEIKEMLQKEYRTLMRHDLQPQQRFQAWTFAAAFVTVELLHRTGIATFVERSSVRHCLNEMSDSVIKTEEDNLIELLPEFVREYAENISVVNYTVDARHQVKLEGFVGVYAKKTNHLVLKASSIRVFARDEQDYDAKLFNAAAEFGYCKYTILTVEKKQIRVVDFDLNALSIPKHVIINLLGE